MQAKIWNGPLPSKLGLYGFLLPAVANTRLKCIVMLLYRSNLFLRDKRNNLTRYGGLCRNDIRCDRSFRNRFIRFRLIAARFPMRQKNTSLLIAVHIKYPDFPINSPFGR